jgi:hypothetical protein
MPSINLRLFLPRMALDWPKYTYGTLAGGFVKREFRLSQTQFVPGQVKFYEITK